MVAVWRAEDGGSADVVRGAREREKKMKWLKRCIIDWGSCGWLGRLRVCRRSGG